MKHDVPLREPRQAQRVRHLLLNGRFLSRPSTGVDRSATQLVRSMLQLRQSDTCIDFRLTLAVPRNAPPDARIRLMLGLDQDCEIRRGFLTGYLWEQFELPFIARDSTLLSLCNVGPVFRTNQFVMMHDAQVFEAPDSYSFAFRTLYRILLPILARRTRWLGTVSKFSRDNLQRHGVGKGRRISVIPNGMDHLIPADPNMGFLSLNGLRPSQYLLAIGSEAKHKNVAMLAAVLNARKGPKLPLVLVGPETSNVFGGKESQAGNMVQFTGRVTDADLCALYRNAAVFLLPSLTEGFGLPAAEAMSLDCPAIVSTGGALSEVYKDAAIHIEPDDVENWASAIDELIASDELRQEWIQRGQAHVRRNGWKKSARSLLEEIELMPA